MATVIVLNGTSSAGKSTIAGVLQRTMTDLYIHTGIDHYLERVPLRFNFFGDGVDPSEHDGLLWVMENGSPPVTEMRLGPAGRRLLGGSYHAYAALARAGNNLIVDDVLFDADVLREAIGALDGIRAWFIGVRCPLEVAEAREAERVRFAGSARLQFEPVHQHGVYDLEVDTSVLDGDECAQRIKDLVEGSALPSAFDELRARFSS